MPIEIDRISRYGLLGIALTAISILCVPRQAATASFPKPGAQGETSLNWQSPARWRHGRKKTPGTLALTNSGVEFLPAKGPPLRWAYVEIQTFDLAPHRLRVTGYKNRGWRLPGERTFSFDLASIVPSAVAAELAERVAKPAENGVPGFRRPGLCHSRRTPPDAGRRHERGPAIPRIGLLVTEWIKGTTSIWTSSNVACAPRRPVRNRGPSRAPVADPLAELARLVGGEGRRPRSFRGFVPRPVRDRGHPSRAGQPRARRAGAARALFRG